MCQIIKFWQRQPTRLDGAVCFMGMLQAQCWTIVVSFLFAFYVH